MQQPQSHYTKPEQVDALLAASIALRDQPRDHETKKLKKSADRKAKHYWLHVVKSSAYALVIIMLCFVLGTTVLAKQKGEIPSFFGYYIFRVQTGSMVPTLPIGSFIISRAPSDPAELNIGDIVTFTFLDGTVVTHRIDNLYYDDEGQVRYITRGDANNVDDDGYLTPDRVIGVHRLTITLPQIW